MRTILYVSCLALLFTACINNTSEPYSNSTPPPPAPENTPPNQAIQAKAFSIATDAFYQASLSPSSTTEQIVSLNLAVNHSAKLTTEYVGMNMAKVDTGQWTVLNNGNLKLHLRRIGEKDTMSMEFSPDGEKLIYLGDKFGPGGITLWVKPAPNI